MPEPGFKLAEQWEICDLWAVLILHHTSLCKPLNVQLQHSNSSDKRQFPSKITRGECGFLSSVLIGVFLPEPGNQSKFYVKAKVACFSPHFHFRPTAQHTTLQWSCHRRTLSICFKQILKLWLDFPLVLRQSTSVGIKQVIGTSPVPVWWSRATCQYPQEHPLDQ